MNKIKKLIFKCDVLIIENKYFLDEIKEFLKGVSEYV